MPASRPRPRPRGQPCDPLAALDTVIRQAAVLTRAARDQAASLDPARVRAQVAEAEAARRRAEAAAVTAEARAAEAAAETQALAEALDTAREDARAARAEAAAARQQAQAAAAALEQARSDAAGQITAAQAEAAGQVSAAQAEAARYARERDDAAGAARRADAEIARARQAETDARAETDRARADAARERDTLREQHQAQLDAVAALTAAERARAERAEQLLEAERADRRHLTTALTAAQPRPTATATATATASYPGPRAARQASRDRDRPHPRRARPAADPGRPRRRAAPDALPLPPQSRARSTGHRPSPAVGPRRGHPHPARGGDPRPRRSRAADPPQGRRAARREDLRVLARRQLLHPAARPARPDDPGMGHPRGESRYRRPSGTGKSHFAEAIAHKAIDAGMRVAWFTLESLTAALGRAAVDGTTARAIAKITRCDLIAIDDIGMLPAGQAAAEALYRLVDAAYERRSLILTSNLHPSGLDTIMPKTLATATVDRLLHHAHLVLTEGTSLRLAEATAGKGVTPLT